MPPRILISGGASPKFRISKPGINVETATAREDFIIREDDATVFYPDFSGSHVFTGAGTFELTLSPAPSNVPVVFLKSSDGRSPSVTSYFAWTDQGLSKLFLRNEGGARTVYYYVYGNKINGL